MTTRNKYAHGRGTFLDQTSALERGDVNEVETKHEQATDRHLCWILQPSLAISLSVERRRFLLSR